MVNARLPLTVEQRTQLARWMWTLVLAGNSLFGLLLSTILFTGLVMQG